MSFELSWTFNNNVVPTDRTSANLCGKSLFLQGKNALVTAGWTVVMSSNGTTADTSDNISSLTDCVVNTAGNNHSWVVLKSPAGVRAGTDGSYTGDQSRIWFCWELLSSGTTSQTFIWSTAAFTGGSTTNRPTGTNEQVLTNLTMILTSASPGYSGTVFSFAYATDGSFSIRVSHSAGAKLYSTIEFRKLKDPVVITSSGLDHPYGCLAIMWGSGTTQSNVTSVANTQNYGWAHDGTVTKCTLLTWQDVNGTIGYNTGTTGDAINGTNEASEVIVYSDTASGKRSRIGRIPDMFITGATVPTGTVDSNSATNYFMNGAVWLPTTSAFTI